MDLSGFTTIDEVGDDDEIVEKEVRKTIPTTLSSPNTAADEIDLLNKLISNINSSDNEKNHSENETNLCIGTAFTISNDLNDSNLNSIKDDIPDDNIQSNSPKSKSSNFECNSDEDVSQEKSSEIQFDVPLISDVFNINSSKVNSKVFNSLNNSESALNDSNLESDNSEPDCENEDTHVNIKSELFDPASPPCNNAPDDPNFPVSISDIKVEPPDDVEQDLTSALEDPAEEFTLNPKRFVQNESNMFINPVYKYEESHDESLLNLSYIPKVYYKVAVKKGYSKEELNAALIMAKSSSSLVINMEMFSHLNKSMPHVKLVRLEKYSSSLMAFGEYEIIKLFFNKYGKKPRKWKKLFAISNKKTKKRNFIDGKDKNLSKDKKLKKKNKLTNCSENLDKILPKNIDYSKSIDNAISKISGIAKISKNEELKENCAIYHAISRVTASPLPEISNFDGFQGPELNLNEHKHELLRLSQNVNSKKVNRISKIKLSSPEKGEKNLDKIGRKSWDKKKKADKLKSCTVKLLKLNVDLNMAPEAINPHNFIVPDLKKSEIKLNNNNLKRKTEVKRKVTDKSNDSSISSATELITDESDGEKIVDNVKTPVCDSNLEVSENCDSVNISDKNDDFSNLLSDISAKTKLDSFLFSKEEEMFTLSNVICSQSYESNIEDKNLENLKKIESINLDEEHLKVIVNKCKDEKHLNFVNECKENLNEQKSFKPITKTLDTNDNKIKNNFNEYESKNQDENDYNINENAIKENMKDIKFVESKENSEIFKEVNTESASNINSKPSELKSKLSYESDNELSDSNSFHGNDSIDWDHSDNETMDGGDIKPPTNDESMLEKLISKVKQNWELIQSKEDLGIKNQLHNEDDKKMNEVNVEFCDKPSICKDSIGIDAEIRILKSHKDQLKNCNLEVSGSLKFKSNLSANIINFKNKLELFKYFGLRNCKLLLPDIAYDKLYRNKVKKLKKRLLSVNGDKSWKNLSNLDRSKCEAISNLPKAEVKHVSKKDKLPTSKSRTISSEKDVKPKLTFKDSLKLNAHIKELSKINSPKDKSFEIKDQQSKNTKACGNQEKARMITEVPLFAQSFRIPKKISKSNSAMKSALTQCSLVEKTGREKRLSYHRQPIKRKYEYPKCDDIEPTPNKHLRKDEIDDKSKIVLNFNPELLKSEIKNSGSQNRFATPIQSMARYDHNKNKSIENPNKSYVLDQSGNISRFSNKNHSLPSANDSKQLENSLSKTYHAHSSALKEPVLHTVLNHISQSPISSMKSDFIKKTTDDKENILSHLNLSIVNDPQSPQVLQDSPFSPVTSIHGDDNDSASEDSHSYVTQESPDKMKAHKANLQESVEPLEKETDEVMDIKEFTEKFESMNKREKIILYKKHRKLYHEAKRSFMNESGDVYKSKIKLSKYKEMDSFRLMYNAIKSHLHKEREENDKQKQVLLDASEMEKFVTPYSPSMPTCQDEDIYKSSTKLVNDKIKNNDEASNDNCDDEPYSPSCSPLITQKYLCMPEKKRKNSQDQCFETLLPTECQDDTFVPVNVRSSFLIDASLLSNVLDNLAGSRDGPKNDNCIITETEIANTENRSTSSTSNVTKFPFEFDCRNENEEYLLKFFLGGDNERETNGTSTSISGNDDAQFTVLLNEQNVQTQNLCSTDHYICDSITGAPFIQSSAFPGVTLDLATASSHPGVVEETHENKINTSMGLSQATALLLPLPHPPPSPPSMTKLLENETTTVNGLDNRREDLTSMVNDYFQNWEPSNVPDVDVSLETDVEVVFDHVSEKKSQIMAYWEEKLYDEQPFAHELIKQIHGVPLVGLQYVLEVRKEGKQSIENCNYICSLCSKKMSSTTLVAHVKSVPHRLKYTEYFSRELHEKYGKLEVKQWTAALVKEFTSALQEVEKEYGRERMAVTSEKTMTSALTFLKEKSSSLAYKSNSNGSASSAQKAPETPKDTKSNGPAVKRDAKPKGKESPKNVPSRKPEVIVLDNDSSRPSPKTSKTAPPPARKSSPPKSVKRPDQAPGNRSNSNARDVKSKSNERDLKDRNDPRDRGDPKDRGAPKDRNDPKDRSDPRDRIDSRRPDANQPPRKRSRSPPHPPGHADRRPPRARSPLLPRPRGPPLQRGRSPPQQRGRSPPPPRARSPLLPRGRSPLLQRGRSPPPQRGRSPPPPRGRSPQPPRGLFRSRSPLVPRTRSPPRMGPRGRKDQESNLSKFRSEEQKLRADCVRVRDRYIKDPDSHPRYKMEWEKFWDRRYREVKQEGQDVNFYDFKGDWIKFFPSRICEMSNQEFVFKRDQLLNKHNVSDPNPKNKSLPEPRMDFERPNDANRKANKTEKPFPNRRPSPPQRNDFQKRKRSPSPWEANQNGRMGQTEKYEIGYSVVSTLKVLCEFEDQLGSLSTAIKSMFKKASDFNSRGANEIQIFNDPDNVVVLKLAHTKLNSLTLSGVLDVMTIARTQKAIEATDWLIKEAQKADPQSKSKMAELGVDLGHISVATMGKSTVEIAQFIAQYLLNIGKGDADESVLQEILFAVAENHKKIKSAAQSLNSRSSARNPPNPQSYSNFSKTIADNLPVNVSQVNQYEQNALFPSGTGSHPHMMQDSGSKSNALGILQNAYDDKDPKSTKKPLEYMTLDELQEMLLNFRKLDQEEQKELTEFLKRLEATDSKKVTMLRSMMRGAKPAAESARTKPDRSSRDDNERSEQHNYNQHFDRSGDSYGMQSANNSYEQNQKDNYDNEEMDHYGNYKQNDSFQNDYSRSQSKEHMQDRFGQSGFSNNSSGFGNQRSSLLSEPNSKPDYSNERGSFNQTANQGGPFHQSTNQGGSFNESRSSFGSRGALLSTPYQGSGDLSGFDKSYSSIDQDYEDKRYKSSSRNSLLPDPENDAERSESNWYGKSFSENSSKDSPFSQSSSSFMNKEYRISESFGDYSSRGQSGAGSGPFDRGSRGGRDGDRGRSEFSQPEYQSNFNATRGSSRGFGASQRGNDKSRDPSRGQSGPYHSGYKAPSPADEDDMGSFQSSRGRGGSSRGGDTFRGRGDFSRGRGDFSRGRGDASRGGDFSRGRGDPSRGRGGGSYHSSFKASPGDRGSFRGSRGPRRPSRGFRGN